MTKECGNLANVISMIKISLSLFLSISSVFHLFSCHPLSLSSIYASASSISFYQFLSFFLSFSLSYYYSFVLSFCIFLSFLSLYISTFPIIDMVLPPFCSTFFPCLLCFSFSFPSFSLYLSLSLQIYLSIHLTLSFVLSTVFLSPSFFLSKK